MYAVIKTGGKQYRVSPGDVLEVEHLTAKGDQVTFSPILVVTDKGETVYGSKDLKPFPVKAKLVGDAKGDKVTVQKYRPKSGYKVKSGHRQLYSVIEITSIGDQAVKPAAKKSAEKAETSTDEKPAAKAKTSTEKPVAKESAAKAKPTSEEPAAEASPKAEKPAAAESAEDT